MIQQFHSWELLKRNKIIYLQKDLYHKILRSFIHNNQKLAAKPIFTNNVLSCFSRVQLLVTPWTAAYQAPLSMGFSRHKHWSALLFPSPSLTIKMDKQVVIYIFISINKIECASWETYIADQEATVRTGHGTTAWFQIGKGVHQGCILSPCLFNLYAEYIMRNAGLEEAQAGIKIARRNINNLRYADDTPLWQEVKRN